MFSNYFKVAFRNLYKQRFYTFINILGLAVGIACCMLIVLFVMDELSYDQHFSNSDRIYRVAADMKFQDMQREIAVVSAPMGYTMVEDFPEVLAATRFRGRGTFMVKRKNAENNFKEQDVIFADSTIFDVFGIQLLEGNPEVALHEPKKVVISQSAAEKYFPDESPIGQVLTMDNRTDYQVSGVMRDLPPNTHFHFDFLLSMTTLDESRQPVWLSHNFQTYVLVQEGTSQAALEEKMQGMLDTYVGPQLQQMMNIDVEGFLEQGNYMRYYLQPLTDIHLGSNLMAEFEPNSDILYVYLFGAIAIFVLVIACINFMNLSTARSANRAREVGIRKVLGSFRSHLISQFLIESLIVCTLAFGLALLTAELSMPFFNSLSGKELSVPYGSWWLIPVLVTGIGLVGLLAGLYPAFFLSSFQPIAVLKGKLSGGARSSWLRGGLVVFQFFISIVLIVATLVVQRQLNFIQNKKVGFDREQMLIINDTYVMRDQVYAFKEELKQLPEVQNVTVTGFLPVEGYSNNNTAFWPEGKRDEDHQIIMSNWSVDHDYVNTLKMNVVEGRDFSLDFPTDSNAVILNETAVRNFGFENPIGERIQTFTGFPGDDGQMPVATYTVIGVVEDFHYESLREDIIALGLFIGRSRSLVNLRVDTDEWRETISKVEAKWEQFVPGQPMSYQFLDEQFDKMYAAEQRLGKIFSIFTGMAIVVACLGLFALAAYMAEQRRKEIGIRKVLGASMGNIIALLTREFSLLIVIALIPASLVAWYGMNQWLQAYTYRISITWDVFVVAGLAALLIAWLTVSYQAMRAARINPVESLRDE